MKIHDALGNSRGDFCERIYCPIISQSVIIQIGTVTRTALNVPDILRVFESSNSLSSNVPCEPIEYCALPANLAIESECNS